MEQDAFLQGREGVDVRDVRGAALDPADDQVDLGLGEFHQRQHLRRDRLCAGRDQVGRDVDRGRSGHLGQPCRCRRR
ncbi:hypothetical protein [Dactylosporangium maewongense]|uniref:hypothetical protein n=1 Tax=Dactylosporangium maewongense TaxID=634393 RepID=UPI0031DD41C3